MRPLRIRTSSRTARWTRSTACLACGAIPLACATSHPAGDAERTARRAEATSVAGQATYAFDRSGFTTSVATSGATYAVTRAASAITAGADAYGVDALGRVTSIDTLAMTYGPDGQIARATGGAQIASYLYDEEGNRILKSVNGAPAAAYVDAMVVTPTDLYEPVSVAGHRVGIVRNGALAFTATDMRGTVEADLDGTSRLAAPFGTRPVRPDVAAVADYAAEAFDADLGADRMGVRDYDARIAMFLQPDPLFLAHPQKCVESPVECNLYGYARNRPLDFRDPTGTDARPTEQPAAAASGSTSSPPADIRAASQWAMQNAPSCFGHSCAEIRATQAARWPLSIAALPYGPYVMVGGEIERGHRKAEAALIAGYDPQIGFHVSVLVGGGFGGHVVSGVVVHEFTLWSSSGQKAHEALAIGEISGKVGGAGAWKSLDSHEYGAYGFVSTPTPKGSLFAGAGTSITFEELRPDMERLHK